MIASFFCYKALGSDLLPAMDEGGFVLDYVTPAGTSLEETNRMISHIGEMIHEIPEVKSYSRRTGLQLGLAAVTEANTGDFAVKLKNKRSRGRGRNHGGPAGPGSSERNQRWMSSSFKCCRT